MEMEYLASNPDILTIGLGQGMYCGYLGRSLMDMGGYLSQSPLFIVLGEQIISVEGKFGGWKGHSQANQNSHIPLKYIHAMVLFWTSVFLLKH